ncbi:signal peptidase I [Rhodothalassium salexigens DSM 2132]|uniref:Signal peptidase I n=1 Tax=Rhodothalassium salexigens DSM 2132 TaxID=1188247 RepID=A0A4V2SNK1_RHOSA|nr:signal peptidase I [Rhodothalassium salexigens]MBB4212482.1 signal peptidase I [Rhodothalassium salexigens DSM 2132]MBK1640103.1 signal peptidase I [Rhodothalassium salexigens DSM 2132]TCP31476.1 signal peptidase I [Rhodothalassium salexigens DSM 2132]
MAMKQARQALGLTSKIGGLVRDVAVVIAIWLGVTTLAYASYHIPSESMVPTLEVGDRLLVNKYVYGYSRYSMPFNPPLFDGRILKNAPERGDIAVFFVPKGAGPNIDEGTTYIKRVVGLPGDTVQVRNGRLVINATVVPRRALRTLDLVDRHGFPVRVTEYEETLPGGTSHRIYERSDRARYDNTRTFRVPEDHYFMMGDNRDNSEDSRAPGGFTFVPAEQLIGRADVISFSIADCDRLVDDRCAAGVPVGRFFRALN